MCVSAIINMVTIAYFKSRMIVKWIDRTCLNFSQKLMCIYIKGVPVGKIPIVDTG